MISREKMKSSLFAKAISCALVISFSIYNVGFALPEADVKPPEVAAGDGPLSVEDIGIAIDAGTVKSKYSGTTGKVIIHIQDAHCNFEAQSNISSMLEQLAKESGINMISVEGAEGVVDTAWFKAFPDAEIRKEVATYFMKKGEITGAEYFSINSDYKGTIFGAETRDYYVKNLKAFTEVYPYKDMIESYLKNVKSVGARLKSIVYTPRLRELDSKINAFDDKELELSEFAAYLNDACSANGISEEGYPNFKKLVDTLEYEQKIDFDVVDNERSRYIDMLSKKLSKEEMTELVAESIRFKKGHIKAVDFYSFLRDLAKAHNVDIVHEYPNLFYYYIYTKIYDGIDNEGLFRELDGIVRALKGKLITDDAQKKLDKYSEMVDMMIDLVNIELTNEDYDLFQQYASDFTIEDVLVFYSGLVDKYNLNYSIGTLPTDISGNLPKMVSFYEIAMKRDNALITNTLRQMDVEGKDRCVLIAGGFHTRGIKNLLEQKGVSYLVVTPKITKDVETPYIKVLTNQRTSIEDIITESAAMPGTAIRTSKEKITDNVSDLLSPLMRFGYGITMYLNPEQRQALRKLSEQMGGIEGVGLEYEGAVVATFEEAVQLLTLEWIMKVKSDMINQLGMTPSLANAEFSKFINNDDLWNMLTAVYLSKYDDYFEATGAKPSAEVKAQIRAEFDKYRDANRQTPGVQAAGARVLTPEEAVRFDSVVRASFEAGTWSEEPIGKSIGRPEFKFIVHDGLLEALANEGFPEDAIANIHPGRGGKLDDGTPRNLLQGHMDRFVFSNLNTDELLMIARHELAHLDIFNANEGSETYVKWVQAGSPTGQAQEDFVNNVLGYDVTAIAAKIEKIAAEKLSEQRMLNLDPSLKATSDNVDFARKASEESQSTRIVGVVSGSEVDQKNWGVRLKKMANRLFNRDGSTTIVSLQEKTGEKTREGNFLGTLLAYRKIKEIAAKEGVDYKNFVTLLGMLFGRGERMSPYTQMKGDRKPSIQVTASYIEIDGVFVPMTAIEEAMMYFTPVAIYLEKRGFRGILDKWGDETEIASVDLTKLPTNPQELAENDVIKIVSVLKITDELAEQKDWVVFDEDGNMVAQLSRNGKETLINQLVALGITPREDGEYYAGVSLGPVAVSYDVLDIAEEVFTNEIVTDGVYFDFDPYFLMALAMPEDPLAWQEAAKKDSGIQKLEKMVPDFFVKVQSIKQIFLQRYNRPLNLKTLDLGADVFWADIGQHSAMREKYLAINDRGPQGIISRKLEGITGERDANGNILVNSTIAPGANVRNSVIINSNIGANANINGAVVKDSTLNNVTMEKGSFAVSSYRTGKTVLKAQSGIFESYGSSLDELTLVEHGRHGTLLTAQGPVDLKVHERTNLRDKATTYDIPLVDEMHDINNPISFDEAYNEMFGVSMADLETRRAAVIETIRVIDQRNATKPLKFGTSGLRDTVTNMTDQEVYINARGFVKYLIEKGELDRTDTVYVAGDLRPSTPRLMTAVGKAIEDEGIAAGYTLKAEFDGFLPSPGVSSHGFATGKASVMVTGSHIPADRNGIKFNKKSGEVLKSDEKGILANVLKARKEVYRQKPGAYIFDANGAFKSSVQYEIRSGEVTAKEIFKKRYFDVFPNDALKGKKVFLYQHSAVGRDLVAQVLRGLGAEVITPGVDENGNVTSAEDNTVDITYTDEDGTEKTENVDLRSEVFVPVDTEKVGPKTRAILEKVAKMYQPDVIISTDGDSDRPLLADQNGIFLPGDKLGALVSIYLKPTFAAIPVSANDAVVTALRNSGIKVEQTQIGSPYVIAAMNEELARFPEAKVVSWEVNGGFLTGSPFTINGKTLAPLPTRDAILPVIATILLAKQEGKKISVLVDTRLPARYTDAGVVDDKTPGLENYKAEMGKEIISMFSPKEDIYSVVFYGERGNLSGADYKPGVHRDYASLPQEERDKIKKEFSEIRARIAKYFNPENGFGKIVSINFIDGIRVVFDNNEVAHMRPSGNAPEFRMYATADTQQRATEIAESRKEIVPLIVADLLTSGAGKASGVRATPGIFSVTASSKSAPKEDLRVPVIKERRIAATEEYEYTDTVVITQNEDGKTEAYDEISIFGPNRENVPDVLQGRVYNVDGNKGEMAVEVDGEEAAVVSPEMSYMLVDAPKEVTFSKAGPERAVAELKYANTPREQAAYSILYMVEKHRAELKKLNIKIHIPQELFYPGDDIGSAKWTETIIQGMVGKNIELSTYNASLGLQDLAKRSIVPGDGYIHILVAADKQLENSSELADEKVKDFVSRARPLPIPKAALALENGWDFSLETVGWGLILGAVTPEQIKDVQDINSPAADVHGFIKSVLKKDVPREYLYMMLPYESLPNLMDQIESEEIKSVLATKNILAWMHFLVQNILFEMPIKAFDPRDALRQRMKVMWSV